MPRPIKNPILRGFNPDPSICRVGDDYYIATSTFEWFPGVQIHHSRDLRNWRLLTHALTNKELLDLRGNPNSGGVWAPCLSHDGEQFHLVYTDVKSWGDTFNDSHNYLITTKDIEGPWSERILLNSSGFDASMFHDTDGTKWLLNMQWDFRPGRDPFRCILMQEYDPQTKELIGQAHEIFSGTGKGLVEGPHLYQLKDKYYLLVAEGGTVYEHQVAMARSTSRLGPYEIDPQTPLLTSDKCPDLTLQKAGHASLVQTQEGDFYLAHLTGRPQGSNRRCTLGRETALQRLCMNSNDWLRLENGGHQPEEIVQAPQLPDCPWPQPPLRRSFDNSPLPLEFQSLRVPVNDTWLSQSERPGFLRLRGRESPSSLHRQSLLARRVQSHHIACSTSVEFSPETIQQFAGLVVWYDTRHHFSLCVGLDEELGRCLRLLQCDKGEMTQPAPVLPCPKGAIELHAEIRGTSLSFSCKFGDGGITGFGPDLDASILSDDYVDLGFTGAFVGMAAYDLTGTMLPADFSFFDYQEL